MTAFAQRKYLALLRYMALRRGAVAIKYSFAAGGPPACGVNVFARGVAIKLDMPPVKRALALSEIISPISAGVR